MTRRAFWWTVRFAAGVAFSVTAVLLGGWLAVAGGAVVGWMTARRWVLRGWGDPSPMPDRPTHPWQEGR